MKLIGLLVMLAVSCSAAEIIRAKAIPGTPQQPTPQSDRSASYWSHYEVTFKASADSTADAYRVTLEYTDIEGVEHSEVRTVDRAESMTVIFTPKPFIWGKLKLSEIKVTEPVVVPVWNHNIR